MIAYDIKCTGCRACEKRCPVSAISMSINNEGFLYPEVDKDKCIGCGVCDRFCPVKMEGRFENPLGVWAVRYTQNEEGLRKSTSGGAFLGLAQYFLEQGGVVVGAAYTSDWRVEQVIVDNMSNLSILQGSKYVQGDVKDTYEQVERYLADGRLVLYSGTPCQIAGLSAYLGKNDTNLVTIDFICHGVPSATLFQRYIYWQENRMKGKVEKFEFRDKGRGWGICYYKCKTRNRSKSGSANLDPFYRAYLKGYTYRESCYYCPYAKPERGSDITVGDCWGIGRLRPQFCSKKGISVVMLNTPKGIAVWEQLKDRYVMAGVKLQDIAKYNKNLSHPVKRPQIRDSIYEGLEDETIFEKRGFRVGIAPKSRLVSLIPWKIRLMLKKL